MTASSQDLQLPDVSNRVVRYKSSYPRSGRVLGQIITEIATALESGWATFSYFRNPIKIVYIFNFSLLSWKMERFPIIPSTCSTEMSWWQPNCFNSSSFSSIPVLEISKLSQSHSLWPQLKTTGTLGNNTLWIAMSVTTYRFQETLVQPALSYDKCLHLISFTCPLKQEKESLWFHKSWSMRLWRVIKTLLGEFASYLDGKTKKLSKYNEMEKDTTELHQWWNSIRRIASSRLHGLDSSIFFQKSK